MKIKGDYKSIMSDGLVSLERAENCLRYKFKEEALKYFKLAEHSFAVAIDLAAEARDNETAENLKSLLMFVGIEIDELEEELNEELI